MQRDGPAQAIVRGKGPRIPEQAPPRANSPTRTLLRPTQTKERRRRRPKGPRCHCNEEPTEGRHVAREGERGAPDGAIEDEDVHPRHTKGA